VAPAVLRRHRIGGEACWRRRDAVRAVEQATHRPAAGRRRAVALTLVGADAAAPYGAAQARAVPERPARRIDQQIHEGGYIPRLDAAECYCCRSTAPARRASSRWYLSRASCMRRAMSTGPAVAAGTAAGIGAGMPARGAARSGMSCAA